MAASYTGLGQQVRTSAGANTYQYDGSAITSLASGGASSSLVLDPQGNAVSERVGSETYYYICDAFGSVVALTDGNGNTVNTYSYDPYGNVVSASIQVSNPYQYAGGVWDPSTDLYKMGARYYNLEDDIYVKTVQLHGHLSCGI